MNPEEQGLKPERVVGRRGFGFGLRDESRRTRIETHQGHCRAWARRRVSEMNPEEQGLKPDIQGRGRRGGRRLRDESRRTRIETGMG